MSKPLELKPFRWVGPLDSRQLSLEIRPHVQVYQAEVEDGHLTVIAGKAPSGWHLSISHRKNLVDPFNGRHLPGRIPHYEELKAARQRAPDDAASLGGAGGAGAVGVYFLGRRRYT